MVTSTMNYIFYVGMTVLAVSEIHAEFGTLITSVETLEEYEKAYSEHGVNQQANPIYKDNFNMEKFRSALTKHPTKRNPRYTASVMPQNLRNYVVQIRRQVFTYENAEFIDKQIPGKNCYAYRDNKDVFVVGAPANKSQEEAAFIICGAYSENNDPDCYLNSILWDGSLIPVKNQCHSITHINFPKN